MDWYQKKNTPTVTSHIPLFFGGVFEQNVRVFEARKMEWRMDFFVSSGVVDCGGGNGGGDNSNGGGDRGDDGDDGGGKNVCCDDDEEDDGDGDSDNGGGGEGGDE